MKRRRKYFASSSKALGKETENVTHGNAGARLYNYGREEGGEKSSAIPAFLNEPRVQTTNEPTREESQLLN